MTDYLRPGRAHLPEKSERRHPESAECTSASVLRLAFAVGPVTPAGCSHRSDAVPKRAQSTQVLLAVGPQYCELDICLRVCYPRTAYPSGVCSARAVHTSRRARWRDSNAIYAVHKGAGDSYTACGGRAMSGMSPVRGTQGMPDESDPADRSRRAPLH